jgi:hypothetical protein
MRQALEESRLQPGQKVSLPSPTGGWNARDSVTAMGKKDAIYLDNFFPRMTDVMLRKGWVEYATIPEDTALSPHNIRTLFSYAPPSGDEELFAVDNTGVYDVTGGGAVSTNLSATTNGEWQYQNMTTPGGNFLWACNGVDKCKLYDGTTWTMLDGTSTPALTGITSTDVVNVSIFKNRLILTKKASLSFYYLPVNSIAGAASEFPLGSLFNLGGYLVATASWSLDGGEGVDDYFVAITSKGEVAVYKGTDPNDATAWALTGVFQIGAPLGYRCFTKVGGDLCVLTVQGIFPLSKALISSSVNAGAAISDKIVSAWQDAVTAQKTAFGWQATLFPEASMLLVNVPIGRNDGLNIVYAYQFVMNTQTGAWARFTNQHAEAWCVHNGELYFACHNKVAKAWTGAEDNGTIIDAKVKLAFQALIASATKRVTMFRPNMTANADVTLTFAIDVDYKDDPNIGSSSGLALGGDRWDAGVWDSARWVGTVTILKWRTVSHSPGGTLSLRLHLETKGVSLTWSAVDFIVEGCGLL